MATSRRHALFAAAGLPSLAAARPAKAWPPAAEIERRVAEVTAAELAFAASMAARDAKAFRALLAPDTIFMNDKTPLRGPDAVMAVWAKFFDGDQPPFAWAPDLVLVLPSGDLAHSGGPVTNPQGKLIARFQSVWRRLAAGGWQIVFDQGSDVCG